MVQQEADRSTVLFPTERFLISGLSSWKGRRRKGLCLYLAGSVLKDISSADQIRYKSQYVELARPCLALSEALERETDCSPRLPKEQKADTQGESPSVPRTILLSRAGRAQHPPARLLRASRGWSRLLSLALKTRRVHEGHASVTAQKWSSRPESVFFDARITVSRSGCRGFIGLRLAWCTDILCDLSTWQTISSVLNNCLEMEFWKENRYVRYPCKLPPNNPSEDSPLPPSSHAWGHRQAWPAWWRAQGGQYAWGCVSA